MENNKRPIGKQNARKLAEERGGVQDVFVVKKLSGSPRTSLALYGLDAGVLLEFYFVVDDHLGIEPDGPNPSLEFRPTLFRVKEILQDYIDRSAKISGKANVSRSPKDTLERLARIERLTQSLVHEVRCLDDPDTEDALVYALENLRNDKRPTVGLTGIISTIRHLRRASAVAQQSILEHMPADSKRNTHWPAYIDPDWHLVIDLAKLYHSAIRNPEIAPWVFARDGCRNAGSDEKLYSGPFFVFVQDCFEALQIPDHSTNRALANLILRALGRWESLAAQGISLPM